MPTVLIVGATGGIGRALAREYADRGWHVGLLGRDSERLEAVAGELCARVPGARVQTTRADVADPEGLRAAFHAIVTDLGQLDLMIYAAGVMSHDHPSAPTDFEAESEMFAVNTVGAVHVIGLAGETMIRAGRGHIAAIGSIAGERGRKANPGYGASKAALHTYLEGMRNRLHPQGVTVSTIKPGFVNTRMLGGKRHLGAIEPADAARRIANALDRRAESFFVPGWWAMVALAIRSCPGFLFKRIGPA